MRRLLLIIVVMSSLLVAYANDTITLPAWYITTTDLNLRYGPSTRFEKATSAEKGARLKVLRFADNGWAEVSYLDGSLYCSPRYIVVP